MSPRPDKEMPMQPIPAVVRLLIEVTIMFRGGDPERIKIEGLLLMIEPFVDNEEFAQTRMISWIWRKDMGKDRIICTTAAATATSV